MIRPADPAVFDRIAVTDSFITRIRSLYRAYGDAYSFAAFWEQTVDGETVALISRFEDKFSLWTSDGCDFEEIAAFLRFQSAGSVMMNTETPLDFPEAAHRIEGSVLEYADEAYDSIKELYEPDFKELYALLKTCESDIFRVPDYLLFLSDLTHRRSRGLLTVSAVEKDGVLAASVMTVSECESAAVLGAVATRPAYRRQGLARALVRDLAALIRCGGRRVFVYSASESNTRFYLNSGFIAVAGFKEFFLP